VLVHNYRPGVIERLGFGYSAVTRVNPGIVFGEVSGYGHEGPWREKAGQDLLVQCLSGITWLSGNADKGPVPLGLALADIITGGHLSIGILSALVRRGRSGEGAKVSVNMLESILDLQFETVTTFFHDGGQPTRRTASNNAHAYLGAPYGVYETADGYMALAMGSIPVLGELLELKPLLDYPSPSDWFTHRDEIKAILAAQLKSGPTGKWLSILEPADIWCAEVLDWDRLFEQDAFRAVEMLQTVTMGDGFSYKTTRCPIRIDGESLKSPLGSPALGEHTEKIKNSLILKH
jgi:crotonobetainyl-CoA:carnitine CoA-transferase CaiB-like acyl-CoA transferase